MTPSDTHRLERALIRFNALTFAVTFGVMCALGLLASTLFLLAKGGTDPGGTMELLYVYLPGYHVSVGGAFIGALWVALFGALLSVGPAWLYYLGVLRNAGRLSIRTDDAELLRATARVDVPTFASSFGLFAGGTLMLATLWLVIRHQPGEALGPHLALLRHYLPGYTVSVPGALIGLVYLFVLGFIAFALVGWIYNRLTSSTNHRSKTNA